MARVCLLTYKEAKRLEQDGVRPLCHSHQHIPEAEADRLAFDGMLKELHVYRTVVVNGRVQQHRDGSRRRMSFRDGRTWRKTYKRHGIAAVATDDGKGLGPGVPVMNLVRG